VQQHLKTNWVRVTGLKKENKTVLLRPEKFTTKCNGKGQNRKYIKRMANTDMKKQMQSFRHTSEDHKDTRKLGYECVEWIKLAQSDSLPASSAVSCVTSAVDTALPHNCHSTSHTSYQHGGSTFLS
jgi:hypothetical protein